MAATGAPLTWRLGAAALRPPRRAQAPAPFPDAVLVDVSLPCSVRQLSRVLYQPGSPFQASWAEHLKATGVNELPWQPQPAGGPAGGAVAVREVHMATPPPPAWAYLVGATPIGSRRVQTLLRAAEGQASWCEEANHLNMPFGSSFHTALQYYAAAEAGGKSCRLRVSFKLQFNRIAPMKGVLTAMVRGEHEKIFEQWSVALTDYLAGCACARAAPRKRAAAAALPRAPPDARARALAARARPRPRARLRCVWRPRPPRRWHPPRPWQRWWQLRRPWPPSLAPARWRAPPSPFCAPLCCTR